MGNSPDSKTPAFAALALIVLGILIAAVQGFTHGSIAGGVIAALGALPGLFGAWKGIQQETQGTLAISIGMVLASLVVGGLLIVLRVVHWIA